MWLSLLASLLACRVALVPCTSPLGAADADCDGLDDRDADGDGAVSASLGGDDCDDHDPALNPLDSDGDGYSTCDGDCDDTRADRGPRGVTPETCDDVDNDCNGVVDVDDLGAPACLVVDEFPQPDRLELDLLVVVDDTGSMLEEEGRLPAVGDALFAVLAGTDTHIGITTNDAEDPETAGHLRPPLGGQDRWLDVLDPPEDPAAWWRGATDVGADGQHLDAGFDAAYSAIAVYGDTFNAGFYRADADLAVWFVSDSNDNSQSFGESEFADWLASLKLGTGRPAPRVDGIVPESTDACSDVIEGGAGATFEDLIASTGGFAGSVCDEDWSPSATAIAELEAPQTQVVLQLSQIPIPATLEADLVTATGQAIVIASTGLLYDPFERRVTVPGEVWKDLSSVAIRYEVLPP